MKKKITLSFLIYGITLFFITLSGFALMPIFERYHISNITGFGWLADFYITHLVHYGFAIILIAWSIYAMVNALVLKMKLDGRTLISAFLLAGLIITGSLMVIKNFSGTPFPFGLIIALDLFHIIFCMGFLSFIGYRLIKREKALISDSGF